MYDVIIMIRTQILLTPDLSEIIREIAIEKGESMSAVIRNLLDKALRFRKKKTGIETLLKMAENASEGKNTPRDLSSNDDYLYKLP